MNKKTTIINFTKYQGAGNDFVIVDAREQKGETPTKQQIKHICSRRLGVGADGFMIVEKNVDTDFMMRYWNADGGESTMCGNGGRCIAHFAHNLGIGNKSLLFMAIDGEHTAQILNGNIVRLKMCNTKNPEKLADAKYFINTGSPHYVEIVDDVDALNLNEIAKPIREKLNCNVNFIEINEDKTIKIRTFERGVEDETYACGTGATAAAIVAYTANITTNKTTLQAVGGILFVEFNVDKNEFNNIYLTGPATQVFTGSITI